MGAVSTIGFKPGNSLLHRLDPRTKQLLVMVLGTACLYGGLTFLCLLSSAILLGFFGTYRRLHNILLEIRYFLLFLLFVFLARMVTLGDHFVPVVETSGLTDALVFCWKLLLIVLMSVLLMATTRTNGIRAALVWLMKPLPFVNERMAATMVGLVVRLLPLILFQAGETGDAMRARCVEGRRNPIVRLTRFTIMLFRRAFSRADDLVDALQARCYNEHRTMPELVFSVNDFIVTMIAVFILLTIFIR